MPRSLVAPDKPRPTHSSGRSAGKSLRLVLSMSNYVAMLGQPGLILSRALVDEQEITHRHFLDYSNDCAA